MNGRAHTVIVASRAFLERRAASIAGAAVCAPLGLPWTIAGVVLGSLVDELRAERAANRRAQRALQGDDTELARFAAIVMIAARVSSKSSLSCADRLSLVMPMGAGLDRRAIGRLDEIPLPSKDALAAVIRADAHESWRAEAFSTLQAMATSDPSRFLSLVATCWGIKAPQCDTFDYASSGCLASLDEAYTLLGLKPGSGSNEARRVYRELSKRFHPDALEGLGTERIAVAKEAFIKIEAAYRAVLSAEALSSRPGGESWRRGPEASR